MIEILIEQADWKKYYESFQVSYACFSFGPRLVKSSILKVKRLHKYANGKPKFSFCLNGTSGSDLIFWISCHGSAQNVLGF